jgi:kynureninase
MGPEFVPADGAAAWQVSNPPILSAAPLLASLAIFEAAGIEALRAKSLQMTSLLLDELERLAAQVQIITPRVGAQRGNQLSLRLRAGADAGRRAFATLSRNGVMADWREPDVLRIAFAPLYNSFGDVASFCDALGAALGADPGRRA